MFLMSYEQYFLMNFQQGNSPYRRSANNHNLHPQLQQDRYFNNPQDQSPSFRRSPSPERTKYPIYTEPIWQKLYQDGLNNKKVLHDRHQDNKNKIDTECTFQPIIKHNKRYLANSNSTFLERVQIWQENKIEKMIKEKEEEVDKDLKQCTFVPKLIPRKRQYYLETPMDQSKRFEKSQTNIRKNPNKIVNPYYSPIKKQKINTQAKTDRKTNNNLQFTQLKAMIRTQLKRIVL